ncbi:UDP-glycosyltransferase 73C3 [Cannabis sativa]|uniref:UDP-glycosyltransferase 73C3 n=1 Tax=Cannabis sativa TaxID=3483 RepID=UPI0029CA08AD|nr:UDP-glycosyltransferase 73C3 [Cannabis sativa]
MGIQAKELHHFILFPFLAQGHLIPMVDIARMLAQRGVIITIFTTTQNAARVQGVLNRAKEAGLRINLIQLKFPYVEAGLPQGCESLEALPSPDLGEKFFSSTSLLQKPVETMMPELTPPPTCVISDPYMPWTINIARKLNIPRIVFHARCNFFQLCSHLLCVPETEYIGIPGLPDRIDVMKAQLPEPRTSEMKEFQEQMKEAEMESYGVIINSFEELEPSYVKEYKKMKSGKLWCVGPASLCNKNELDNAERGKKSSIDEHECLKWLDSWKPSSVIYVCFGSIFTLTLPQSIELALGLEASNKPFIWVVRDSGSNRYEELEKWFKEYEFEERIKRRGMVIRGWAPQVLILSHPSIGAFLTHCGWNSTLEAISSGIPMVTWPLFTDQFLNEKLVAQVLKTAVTVGSKYIEPGEEDQVMVKSETIQIAIEKVLDDQGEESIERRERAKKFGEMAKRAVEEGGSSHSNITLFLEEVGAKSYLK